MDVVIARPGPPAATAHGDFLHMIEGQELKNTRNRRLSVRWALSALMVAAMAACGGGGGGGFAPITSPSPTTPASTPASTTTTVTGVAAVGAPISGGTVELKCASGATASATTDTDGVWTASLKSTDYPCAARVTGTQSIVNYASVLNFASAPSQTVLHSVVAAPGTTNITPLTDLIVGILSGQVPATWFASSTNGALTSLITSTALADALAKFKLTLATLPGRLALPDGFDPLTSQFSATKGDAGDDLIESYRAALQGAGLSQTEAATRAAAGQALTLEAYAGTAFTTPNLTTMRVGAAKTLTDTYTMSIPDPHRGTVAISGTYGSAGNLATLSGMSSFVSLDGNRVGELCVSNASVARSQYVYVAEDLVPVSDPAELQGLEFAEYENCTRTGTSRFQSDGSFVFQPAGQTSDPATEGIAQAFAATGLEQQKSGGTAVLRAKAFKYQFDGMTKYVYVFVSSTKGATTPVTNGDLDYVLMGVSEQPS
ncbi:hypothetical protein [Variovorax saccharolyticus]|uniref:hypothetical protein n=1 Tax=Variovorax saccharolyticus TaxID=3053516 RepID=UPI0025783C37|nr:hypothetical protein [Variovorax sp. J22R187]MDM0019326.1 hypothetical protein [Variovorax sp. J22R187]